MPRNFGAEKGPWGHVGWPRLWGADRNVYDVAVRTTCLFRRSLRQVPRQRGMESPRDAEAVGHVAECSSAGAVQIAHHVFHSVFMTRTLPRRNRRVLHNAVAPLWPLCYAVVNGDPCSDLAGHFGEVFVIKVGRCLRSFAEVA